MKKATGKNKLLNKILKLNSFIFPFLVPLTYFFLSLETYSYIGFLRKFFLVDSRFFLGLCVISAFGVNFAKFFYQEKKEDGFLSFVFKSNFVLTPLFLVFYFILITLENKNYPNYIFSTYHLQPDNFFNLVILGIFLSIFGFIYFSAKSDKLKKFFSNFLLNYLGLDIRNSFEIGKIGFKVFLGNILIIVCIFLLIVYFFDNFSKTLSKAIKNNIYVLTHLNASYDDKMRKNWGFYYDYMKFVKENTPEDATILIPPQSYHWLSSGNGGLNRYFLYPRKQIHGEVFEIPKDGYDYVMISKGEWYAEGVDWGWPKVNIDAEKIIYLNPENREVSIFYDTVFDAKDEKNKYAWGIIKVKK
jgi:hypothetical protein